MDYSNVKHIVEVHQPNLVHEYVCLGWELLQILNGPNQTVCYILGSDEDEPRFFDPYAAGKDVSETMFD